MSLPEYIIPVAPPGGEGKTDRPEDFLIPLDGVTLCVPPAGDYLVLLNPDPVYPSRLDADHDFT